MRRRRLTLLLAVLGAVALVAGLAFAALPAASDDPPPTTCFTYSGTETCQPADDVAEHGIYIAIVDCDDDTAEIHGVVPDDATRVTTVGADTTTSAYAGPDGAVSLTVDGATLTGLSLDNGHTASLDLSDDCDRPSTP